LSYAGRVHNQLHLVSVRLSLEPIGISAVLALSATLMASLAGWGVPPVGDGALHVNLARQIAELWSPITETVANYPPFYHVFAAVSYVVAGEAGVRLLAAVSFGLASLFTFLLARRLIGDERFALMAQVFVSTSPVLLWYSSFPFMEPALAAAVLGSACLVLRAQEDPSRRNVVAAALSLAVVVLIKQTGVPVAVASLAFAAASRIGIRRSALMAAIVVGLAAGPYLMLYSRTGSLIDTGQVSIAQLQQAEESPVGSIISSGAVELQPAWSLELDQEADGPALYARGTAPHEARHVYWRNLLNWARFTWLHTLYPQSFNGYEAPPLVWMNWLADVGIVAGLAAALVLAIRQTAWRLPLVVLAVSYAAMTFGSDTKRLFLYVTAFSAIFLALSLKLTWSAMLASPLRNSVGHWAGASAAPAVVTVIAVLGVVAFAPLVLSQFRAVDAFQMTQGGGFPSVGGVRSVAETGEWLNENLDAGESFVAASVYEWEYYSRRQDLWDDGLDYRTYFLPPDRLDFFLRSADARYVVVRDNQVVPDELWNHIEQVPGSYVDNLESLYPLAYTSSYGDIRVYRIA
jgi:hypothetical protein